MVSKAPVKKSVTAKKSAMAEEAAVGSVTAKKLPAGKAVSKTASTQTAAVKRAPQPLSAPLVKAASKKAPATPTGPSSAAAGADAIKLLTADHKEVHALFQQYQKLCDADATGEERQPLAEQICLLLTVHATIEEEIFYPKAREARVDSGLLDEAEVEHASAKDLIAQIRGMTPEDALYDAKVTVLGEYIDHHVEEEQGEMFPKCRKARMDLKSIGTELATRKSQLMAEMSEGMRPA